MNIGEEEKLCREYLDQLLQQFQFNYCFQQRQQEQQQLEKKFSSNREENAQIKKKLVR